MQKTDPESNEEVDQAEGLFWEADAFLTYTHSSTWYATVVSVALVLISASYLLRNELQVSVWLLMAVIAAGATVMILRSVIKPPRRRYGISVDGIVVEQKTTPFNDFRSFAVINLHDHSVLRLWLKEKWSLPISIMIEDIDNSEIKQVLDAVLPEEDHDGGISDYISRIVRF